MSPSPISFRSLRRVATVIALVMAAFSSAPTYANTIADVVAASGAVGDFDTNNSDYDMLLAAADLTGLVGFLADESNSLTVFAPNDGAFIRTARDLGYDGRDEAGALMFIVDALGPTLVRTVLEYHVVEQEVDVIDFFILSFLRADVMTVSGETFRPQFFRIRDNDPDLRNPRLRFPLNLQTDNGIIHTINRVLIPADL